ncbi:MAG: hypothetical protein NZ700_05630 [Gemmataceae bacterium]|nr:hypothetical protein [Gemmataceae bacterium]MDW8265871.1 hypothetical protein [Gemmataceae bacterium]
MSGVTRMSIVVGLLAVAGLAADKPPRNVQVSGILRTGVVAIGGETTGTVVETKEVTYELDFGTNRDLRRQAEALNGRQVVVTGVLRVRPGVEVPLRRIIQVTTLREAAK